MNIKFNRTSKALAKIHLSKIFFIKVVERYIVFAFLMVYISCTPVPNIQINDTLKTGLGKNYKSYVLKLNASIRDDKTMLNDFLIAKNLFDGAAYEHGWVLIELMRKLGDEKFTKALNKLNKEQLGNLRIYFSGGLDIHNRANDLPIDYPKSFKKLGL